MKYKTCTRDQKEQKDGANFTVHKNNLSLERSEVLAVVITKIYSLQGMTPCSLVDLSTCWGYICSHIIRKERRKMIGVWRFSEKLVPSYQITRCHTQKTSIFIIYTCVIKHHCDHSRQIWQAVFVGWEKWEKIQNIMGKRQGKRSQRPKYTWENNTKMGPRKHTPLPTTETASFIL
jgi:hypothetical protein